jgi:hypothetical protein
MEQEEAFEVFDEKLKLNRGSAPPPSAGTTRSPRCCWQPV